MSNHTLQVSIPVSTRTGKWIAAEVLRDEFVHSRKDLDAVDTTAELKSNWEATLDLFAHFWGFVAGSLHGDQQSFRARTSLLASILAYFTATYLTECDVHSVVATCDADVRQSVLSSYFRIGIRSFLVVKVYFNESLYDIYKPYMAPLISTVTDKILKHLAPAREATSFYAYGLDVSSLAGTKPRPSIPYLAFPLIGLTWLVNTSSVACHTWAAS